MSSRLVRLGYSEVVAGRPFTNPEGSQFDLTVLQYMAETLFRILTKPEVLPVKPRPLVRFLDERGGRLHRVALTKPELLLKPNDLAVVGFCGQKRPGVDRGPIDAVDDELIRELPDHTHILSYSTLELESGNSCNLVLFSDPHGISHWSSSDKHALAVSMSPGYYTVIRLHNAYLPGGIVSNNRLILIRTKYIDYQEPTPWRAVREFLTSDEIETLGLAF